MFSSSKEYKILMTKQNEFHLRISHLKVGACLHTLLLSSYNIIKRGNGDDPFPKCLCCVLV